jgi:hypothetical protein
VKPKYLMPYIVIVSELWANSKSDRCKNGINVAPITEVQLAHRGSVFYYNKLRASVSENWKIVLYLFTER